MEFYAKALDLNVQTYSRVVHTKQQDNGTWKVEVDVTTKGEDGESKTKRVTICAQHVIFAMGNASHPRIPKLPGSFGGTQLHSSKYQGGRPFANQQVVVVGSNNSGFDIAQDLWEQGAKTVSMIQRSPSLVVSTKAVLKQGLGPLYREDAPLHHEQADLVATTMPYKLLLSRWTQVTQQMRETDADLHRGLIEAGYHMDFGPDGTGLFAKSATEGGGFYINMGCAKLLTRGDVSVRYTTVSRLEPDSVVIVNKDAQEEERLPVDVIIYATGYDTMDQWVAELCGEDISKAVGRTWGLGFGKRPKDPGPWEGELRNVWKPTTVEGLWFHGGNLAQSRHYSRFLALQLAARYMDMDTPVYGIPKPTAPTNLS
jgi:putative flavoprotein involved in K+ transport